MRFGLDNIGTIPPGERFLGMKYFQLSRKMRQITFFLAGCNLRTRCLLARTSSPALWILIGMVRNRLRCSLMRSGCSGLITVMQRRHKEAMRISKRIYERSQCPISKRSAQSLACARKKQACKFSKSCRRQIALQTPTHRTKTKTSDGWGTISLIAGQRCR